MLIKMVRHSVASSARTVIRIIDREPICNGNVETVRTTMSRDSIIAWHFRSFPRKRHRTRGWQADPAGPSLRRPT
jgi:hypothetical protein